MLFVGHTKHQAAGWNLASGIWHLASQGERRRREEASMEDGGARAARAKSRQRAETLKNGGCAAKSNVFAHTRAPAFTFFFFF